MPVEKLLSEMLKEVSIAVVVNEHGGTIGLVTLKIASKKSSAIYDENDPNRRTRTGGWFEETDAMGRTAEVCERGRARRIEWKRRG